jgi:hypothetical protein
MRIQFAAIFLAVKGIINVTDAARADGSFDASDVFLNPSRSAAGINAG